MKLSNEVKDNILISVLIVITFAGIGFLLYTLSTLQCTKSHTKYVSSPFLVGAREATVCDSYVPDFSKANKK